MLVLATDAEDGQEGLPEGSLDLLLTCFEDLSKGDNVIWTDCWLLASSVCSVGKFAKEGACFVLCSG